MDDSKEKEHGKRKVQLRNLDDNHRRSAPINGPEPGLSPKTIPSGSMLVRTYLERAWSCTRRRYIKPREITKA
jgi:hypothetical protein